MKLGNELCGNLKMFRLFIWLPKQKTS